MSPCSADRLTPSTIFLSGARRSGLNFEWILPTCQLSSDLSHDARCNEAKNWALSLGIPPPFDVLPMAAFSGQEILSVPLFGIDATTLLRSIQSTALLCPSYQFTTWDILRGTLVERPCAVALHLVAAFATKLIRIPRQFTRHSSLQQSLAHRALPVDLSDARGWQIMSSFIRQAEIALIAALWPRYLGMTPTSTTLRAVPRASWRVLGLNCMTSPYTFGGVATLTYIRTHVRCLFRTDPRQFAPLVCNPQCSFVQQIFGLAHITKCWILSDRRNTRLAPY